MARKKAAPKANRKRPHASQLRRGEKSSKDLRLYTETLRKQVGDLLALAQAMDEMELDSVRMDGVMKIDQGLKKIDEFIGKLEYAINEQKREMRRVNAAMQ